MKLDFQKEQEQNKELFDRIYHFVNIENIEEQHQICWFRESSASDPLVEKYNSKILINNHQAEG
jgi:hypothetical protein